MVFNVNLRRRNPELRMSQKGDQRKLMCALGCPVVPRNGKFAGSIGNPPGQLRFVVDRRNNAAWEKKNTASPSADIGNSCTFIGEFD